MRLSLILVRISILAALLSALIAGSRDAFAADAPSNGGKLPNIIYILCDDLGYGDPQCLNPESKIATPSIDRLAREGMIFTDAHSGSSVCTPTRYGVLTGRYSWRTKLQSGVLGGLSPRLIESDRMTAASYLKAHGYRTACIGKWHLGMDWVVLPGKSVSELNIETPAQVHNVDYSRPIANGPQSVGFDNYFGISASLDMVPYTYVENDRAARLPTVDKSFPMMTGRTTGQTRLGPATPDFEATNVLPTLTARAVQTISDLAQDARDGKPFFIYLPLASPHTPIVPTSEWLGKSGLNPYADFVMQTDEAIGNILELLDAAKLSDNTLIILTSDNGCSPQAKFDELLAKGHNPSYKFRGHKADIYEGGHRVPFIVRWPARVKAGTTTDRLTCLTDFLATCAEIVGEPLPDTAGEDSVGMLDVLTGKGSSAREAVVHHSINGSFAIRQGNWKLCLCPGSGGWSAPRPGRDNDADLPPVQLFDLDSDIGETKNLRAEHPEVVQQLTALLEKYVAEGRSTPGKRQQNAVDVKIRK